MIRGWLYEHETYLLPSGNANVHDAVRKYCIVYVGAPLGGSSPLIRQSLPLIYAVFLLEASYFRASIFIGALAQINPRFYRGNKKL